MKKLKQHVAQPGFSITGGRGFHITFENGYTVSVQFGTGNYRTGRDITLFPSEALQRKLGEEGSTDAECAVWGPDGKMLIYDDWSETVGGWMSPSKVLELFNWAANQTKEEEK